MTHGSLDTWLHCREEGMESLDWRTRLKVARGAAEGLAFLHHDSVPTIIHRDIKASNILLDCNWEARLADFGLARSTRACESHVSTDFAFAGTAGYIPPEYSQASAATTKGDVYSFGVVLLEILTGRRPTDPFFKKKEMSHVVTWILDMSLEEAIEKTLDMTSAASTDEMLELMRIARLCCQDTPSKRPSMGKVVQMLEALERQQSPSRSPSVVLYDDAMSSPRCR
jgi:serine/threonine protein kinase